MASTELAKVRTLIGPTGTRLSWKALFAQPLRETQHLFAIDIARGLGAVSVLFWHYQHFFYHGISKAGVVPGEHVPLSSVFGLLYRHGGLAVQFFWLVSGFVFAATYVGRSVSARAFFQARFARLYPLHVITLIVVAVLQVISMRLVGHAQINPFNDAYHFVLNLFFASSWGLEQGPSFNGPIWSVSVEVLVYGVFWICLSRLFKVGIVFPLAIVMGGIAVRLFVPLGDPKLIDECVIFFFTGTAIYVIYRAFQTRPVALALSALGVTLVGAIGMQFSDLSRTMGGLVLLSGLLVAVCALEASPYGRRLERLRWIGDNTYGTYLWHVPIQITALTIMDYKGISHSLAENPLFLVGYLAITVLFARFSYLYCELPLRNRLRPKPRQAGLAIR
ncbi:acyltransferase family protein [Sphingomonas sp. PAMC 26617]|uniref:acyltransferase family protein n=1 Tax=Sphingomonas sp. PAMC 26617 TaxID=1112216 RepID=UPI0012F47CF7|nr:acyltransferase [Sphingomonas sp. PAMC 26617]